MLLGLVGASGPLPAVAGGEPVKVVATIKPLHALVAGVMSGVATPELLVKGASSPHTYSLRPSDMRLLSQASLVFRMSDTVEPFTAKLIKVLPPSVEVVTLQDAPGLELLERRTGAMFERHVHGAHEHGQADSRWQVDGHAWLDPANAKVLVDRIEAALSAKNPEHAEAFRNNAHALRAKLDRLSAELDRALKPIAGRPYVVFHDAYQYLERRYGLNAVGSIFVSPEVPPSGKRLTELRRKIIAAGAVCVFAEPQVELRLLQNLIEVRPRAPARSTPKAAGWSRGQTCISC